MSTDPVSTVRQMFVEYREKGDVEAVVSFFHPSVEWIDDILTRSTLHGHDGFRDAMRNLAEEGYVTQADPENFDDLGDGRVLARGFVRLVKGESYTDLPAYWAFQVQDGRIVRGGGSTRRDAALRALGLGE